MDQLAEKRTRRIFVGGDKALLQGGLKGLEKECLRITRDGAISLSPHPRAWGSALTHPYVTTDYSEALTEFITPALPDIDQVAAFLHDIHHFAYHHLSTDELLWAASMPCAVGDDNAIPIANYGSSNIGMMKHVYRVGLDYRYGRRMQAIAGVHFNYSLPIDFWPMYQEEEEDAGSLRDFIDDSYFALIRNFHRFGWIIPYLFGNSPAVCKSFLAGRTTRFKQLSPGTYYLPYATSLRVSDIGYKNKNQSALKISYDNLESYVSSLRRAIETPYPEYEAIGIRDGDQYVQLNTNVLQIENEYYSFVRPKRVTNSGENPSAALRERGIEYVEVRALDVSATSPTGVEIEQLRFIEAFLIYCLFEESPPISTEEQGSISYNELTVALRGREPKLMLNHHGRKRRLCDWAHEICTRVQAIAELLDDEWRHYSHAVDRQLEVIKHNELLPSAMMLEAMRESGLPFADHSLELSQDHERFFRGLGSGNETFKALERAASESIEKQKAIEASDDMSFEKYLEAYFDR